MKQLDCSIKNVSKTVITCAVLHNICQIRGDLYQDDGEFLQDAINQERLMREQRQVANNYFENADALRHITAYLDHNKHVTINNEIVICF